MTKRIKWWEALLVVAHAAAAAGTVLPRRPGGSVGFAWCRVGHGLHLRRTIPPSLTPGRSQPVQDDQRLEVVCYGDGGTITAATMINPPLTRCEQRDGRPRSSPREAVLAAPATGRT